MSQKGSQNERDIAKRLSEWWVPGRSDVFWRVLGSGARAKARGRKGMTTYGSDGDIVAMDPIGAPFIRLFTVEAKKGYPTTAANPFEEVDRIIPLTPTKMNFAGWIEQVEESRTQAGAPYWMLIFKRNLRRQTVCVPTEIMGGNSRFRPSDRQHLKAVEMGRMTFRVRASEWYLSFFPLDYLLATMTPDMVIRAAP